VKFNSAFFGIITLAFSPAMSFADSWASLYPGVPHIPNLLRDSDDLLIYDRPMCGSFVKDEITLLNQYNHDAAASKTGQGKRDYQSLLENFLNNPSRSQCHDTFLRVYVLHSVYMLDPSSTNAKGWFMEENSTGTNNSVKPLGLSKSQDYPTFESFPLVMITAAILNRNWVQFIQTPMKAKGREIIGIYQCSETQILLDPNLRPFDLAATFLHELTHLFFDKKVGSDILDAEFTENGKIDWHAFLLEDEAIAISYTAYLERYMSKDARKHMELQSDQLFDINLNLWPYQIEGDLNLFSRHGPISKVVNFTGFVDAESMEAILFGCLNCLLDDQFGSNNPYAIHTNVDPATRRIDLGLYKFRPILINRINQPYFSGLPVEQDEFNILTRHRQELFPLLEFLRHHWFRVLPTEVVKRFQQTGYSFSYSGKVPYFVNGQEVNSISIQGMDSLLSDLEDFLKTSAGSSPVCDRYRKAVKNGELSEYLGTQLDEEDGTPQPGGAGVRGSGPVQPGGAGVRGSLKTAKPCVSFRKDL